MSSALQNLEAEIGRVHHSAWLVVDQPMIDRFADATLDRQYIHVDPGRASETEFGGTVAHGFLILSLLPFFEQSIEHPDAPLPQMQINYGLDKVRFIHPVRAGSRLRARFTLTAVSERSAGRLQLTREVVVEIEGQEKPAMIAISIALSIL